MATRKTSTSAHKPTSISSNGADDAMVFFRLPEVEDLLPAITIDPRDLTLLRRNTGFRALVRDIHAEIYRLRRVSVSDIKPEALVANRGRVGGIEWVLSQLDSYYEPRDENADDSEDMTTDIDKAL